MRNRLIVLTLLPFLLLMFACRRETEPMESPVPAEGVDQRVATRTSEGVDQVPAPIAADHITPSELPPRLIHSDDLVYHGAFRMPDDLEWEYSGYAMTYSPEGDPDGPDDGFPGSLFVLGHDHRSQISEISIPVPVVSVAKNPDELDRAVTLQKFQDISAGMFSQLEIPRVGLEYLPPQGVQSSAKLHYCWGQHFQFEQVPSHGWSELDLSSPQVVGPWFLGEYTNYISNDYLFEIPEGWAAINAPGLHLATGRFRDGSWGGLGPALLAYGPWLEGDPPAPNARLNQVVPLLLYGVPQPNSPEVFVADEMRMITYKEADEWSGGAWLTLGGRSAVILVGTKALGRNWYGFANGVEYPISGDPDEEYPDVPPWPYDARGWWSEDIAAQIIFFDPEDLAAVARGEMETWTPQPYATRTIDEFLFDPGFDLERQKRYSLGAVAFDRERGILYVVERRADYEERTLIHVFKLVD